MIYKSFSNASLSALGLGTMRLPIIDGDYSRIDEEKTAEMIEIALRNGINYFDTAWGYHSGNSERVLGKLLSRYPRESYYLASKFPGFNLSTFEHKEEVFEEQLRKCNVDYFDFYLFHNVCEKNIDAFLSEKYGIRDYLIQKKKEGRIRHLGFSVHGVLETMERFLDAYGEDIEFCQIQLNWLDWKLQGAREKVEMLNARGIPIWVMEPVRGGGLVTLPERYEARLRALCPDRSLPEWAFRFLQSIDGVTVTLSGMSNEQQLRENIVTFTENKPLSREEWDALLSVANDMLLEKTLPCTACRYCTASCPQGLDIPRLLSLYNEHLYAGGDHFSAITLSAIPEEKRPSACIGCKSCEAVCPQKIEIAEALSDFARKVR